MSGPDPGERTLDHGPAARAVSTSVRGNSTAFGFSIMITASFGGLVSVHGTPVFLEIMLFGVGAAAAVGVLEGLVSWGFRVPASASPSEIQLLGTAMNFLSVAAGIATAVGLGEIVGTPPAWPVAAFGAAGVYMLVESVELLLAEGIQRLRGDPRAGEEQVE